MAVGVILDPQLESIQAPLLRRSLEQCLAFIPGMPAGQDVLLGQWPLFACHHRIGPCDVGDDIL